MRELRLFFLIFLLLGVCNEAQAFVYAPYLQRMSTTAVTIAWKSDKAASATVSVAGAGLVKTIQMPKVGAFQAVRVTGLQPANRYSYTVHLKTPKPQVFSSYFTTYPATGNVKYVVYGDTRSMPNRHQQVIDAIERNASDAAFVLHSGDLVENGNDLPAWKQQFFDPAARVMRHIPLYSVLGNHEGNSSNYFKYMLMPGNGRYYSFDVAGVHIIALDSDVSFDSKSVQGMWLISDLKQSQGTKCRFIVMHHPPYSSGPHSSPGENRLPSDGGSRMARTVIPDLASKYKVQAVFTGHDHAYERSVRDGVTYIVSGGGGAPSYGNPYKANNPYSKKFYSGIHYCIITINGSRAAMTVKTPDGRVIESVSL